MIKQIALTAVVAAFSCGTAIAQRQLDPPQWQSIDPPQWKSIDDTPQERYRTARKEAGAAFEEARTACREMPVAERAACVAEARSLFTSDMDEAKRLLEQYRR